MIEKLYTVEEVAQLASVTGRTVRNYLKSGRLVGRKIGGQWRFPENEVQRLLTGAPPDVMDDDVQSAPPAAHAPQEAAARPVAAADAWPEEDAQPDTDYNDYTSPLPADDAVYNGTAGYTQSERAPAPLPRPSAPPPPARYTPPAPMPAAAQPPAYAPPVYTASSAPASPEPPAYAPPVYAAPPVPMPEQPAPYISAPPAAQPMPQPQPVVAAPSGGEVQYYALLPNPAQGGQPTLYPVAMPAPPQTVPAAAAPALPPAEPALQTGAANADSAKPDKPMDTTPGAAAAPGGSHPELSDVGKRIAKHISEVHDCSAGPQTCAVIDLYQPIAAARATSDRLAQIAEEESAGGLLCQCFTEYDERFFMARYTLFGSSAFLMRCLKLIG